MNGPLPGLLAGLTVPASWGYGLAVRARNARFDRGVGVATVTVGVISVGNITAGGSGKTPMVRWVVQRLVSAGVKPAIAMRGYAATGGEAGDETLEHRLFLADVPVLADPDRVGALRSFLPLNPEIGCVVLDDGFQHRQLHRDLDLVLIDATRDTMRDRLLPRGWLREPLEALGRADAIIVTRADAIDERLSDAIRRRHGRPPIAWSRHAWTGLALFDRRDEPDEIPVGWLDGKRVITLLGVGNRPSVHRQIEAAGAAVVADVPARDHERYDRARMTLVKSLCEGVDALVMTSKDWVKVRRLIDITAWPTPIVVPRLQIDVFDGAEALTTMIVEASGSAASRGSPAHVRAH
jgi:tetraacyldisaccharide 4'-kinase